MRVLVLGPNHSGGSLPPYLDAITTGLRGIGVDVDRYGSTAIPYDRTNQRFRPIDDVIAQAQALAHRIDPCLYDLVALHAGNLEIDHLIPVFWARRPPLAYHVHTLEPTLLRDHIPSPWWNTLVRNHINNADGYVCFGRYAAIHHSATRRAEVPKHIAWLPTTIPDHTTPCPSPALARALHVPEGLPVISLYGYAAPWKDVDLLTVSMKLMRRPARVILAGQFWDKTTPMGRYCDAPVRIGVTELVTVAEYLDPPARAALIRASTAGVFPYRQHPSFQGSGAIADYLAHNVPVVATDVANMAELVGDAGRIVPGNDPPALAAALDMITATASTGDVTHQARHRAHRFTTRAHAARCAHFYHQIIDRMRRPA